MRMKWEILDFAGFFRFDRDAFTRVSIMKINSGKILLDVRTCMLHQECQIELNYKLSHHDLIFRCEYSTLSIE